MKAKNAICSIQRIEFTVSCPVCLEQISSPRPGVNTTLWERWDMTALEFECEDCKSTVKLPAAFVHAVAGM